MRQIAIALFFFCLPVWGRAQTWGVIEGRVYEQAERRPVVGASVLLWGTNYGTAADEQGRFRLPVPEGRYLVRVQAVGYRPWQDSVQVRAGRVVVLEVVLAAQAHELGPVTVERPRAEQEAGIWTLDRRTLEVLPGPFQDPLRAIQILPGVATNNELSYQYRVRGGNFDENLVYIEGFEVYKPLRIRQGEQEGLALPNPFLVETMRFYSGGFSAAYGDRMSSALEVGYRRPEDAELGAYIGLTEAGAYAGAGFPDGFALMGVRYARAGYLFGSQELKGRYDPRFLDLQLWSGLERGPWTMQVLGLWARNRFELVPSQRRTYYGTYRDLRSLWLSYEGKESDGYRTALLGLRLRYRLRPGWSGELEASGYATREEERYLLAGQATLYRIPRPEEGDPTGGGHVPIGYVWQRETADNEVRFSEGRLSLGTRYTGQAWMAEARLSLRRLHMADRLREMVEVRQLGSLYTLNRLEGAIRDSWSRWEAYGQLVRLWGPVVLQAGLRYTRDGRTQQAIWSPRLRATYRSDEATSLYAAWGLYAQPPLYAEWRDLEGQPVSTLRAQRAWHYVLGAQRFLARNRWSFQVEVYYKALRELIPFQVRNLRLLYEGANRARGYAYGMDVHLRGEWVPGLESYVSYSYLVTREHVAGEPAWVPRPTDQRHTLAVLFQDYVPGDERWQVHVKLLFGTGVPYTPPNPDVLSGQPRPGPRNAARFPEYKRVDVGLTRRVDLLPRWRMHLSLEVLNLFDMVNTVAYAWYVDGQGAWQRVPTRLTPRLVNLRLRVDYGQR
jgi:hypothetical protein